MGGSWRSATSSDGHNWETERYGRLKAIWLYLRDPMFRYAMKKKREMTSGESVMHEIANIEGFKVVVPETELVRWHSMPPEIQEMFLDHIRQEKKAHDREQSGTTE